MKLKRLFICFLVLGALLISATLLPKTTEAISRPDLVITKIEFPDGNKALIGQWPDDVVPVKVYVKNQGTANVYNVGTRLYLNPDTNKPLTSQYSSYNRVIKSFARGSTKAFWFYVKISKIGPNKIYAFVDPYNKIKEIREYNNQKGPSYITGLQEDLTITRVVQVTSTGSNPKAEEVFQVHFYVKNIGTLEAWDVTTGLYVDSKPVEVVTPTLTRDIRQFSPGAEKRCIFYVKINEPGEHRISAYVDPIEHIYEYNEFNNQHLGILTNVEGKPDLVIDSVTFSPNPVDPFESFDINVTIRNAGNISANESILGISDPLGGRYSEILVNSIGVDESKTVTKSYSNGFPFSGSHSFNVEADCLDSIDEYNEDNNRGSGTLNVN